MTSYATNYVAYLPGVDITPVPSPVTHPACPHCGEALRPARVPGNHDRPAVRFLRCTCGHEEGHALEREAVPA